MNPQTRRNYKQASVYEMESASEIWRFLVKSKNIQPRHYDGDIVFQLCNSLHIAGDANSYIAGQADFGQAMEDHHISREDFIYALFSATQPFAEMMAQLCSFFERHAVRGTDQALRIEFNFDAPGKELTFDLEHFRQWLREWETVRGMIESDCWTTSSLWKLVRAISEEISRDSDLENNRASEWVAVNSYPRRNTASNHWDSPPRPPATGIGEIDHMVRRVFAVVSAVARACAPFGNYEKLVAESTERQRRQLGSRANAGLDNPIPIVEWDLLSLRYLESDYFLAALTRVVWNWVEKLQHIPANNRLAVAQPVLSRLENLFGSIKTKVVPGEIELEKLLSFLSLPIWKQRPALYSAWMLPVIEQALAEYPIQIYSDNGTLRFGFTATPMATFKSSEGEITLVAESRFPLKNPIGEGRTNNVQPDYVFFVGNTNKQPNAKLVLELKQYLRPSLKKFGDALTDYARAFTEAKVVLADYGPISPALIDMLPVNLSNRAVAVGDVRPGGVSEILHLQQHIRATLPPPQVAKHMAPSAVSTIIVDVSGSMRETLTWQLVRKHLHDLEASNPSAAWVAADTGVRATLSGPNAVDQLLALDMSGSTSLAQIASSYQGSTTIVITDEDGEKQLRDEELQLKRIGLARPNGIEWQSTAN